MTFRVGCDAEPMASDHNQTNWQLHTYGAAEAVALRTLVHGRVVGNDRMR